MLIIILFNMSKTFVPKIAMKFLPEDIDLVDKLLGKPVRRIFLTDEDKYSELEKNKITEMRQYMKTKNFEPPKEYTVQDMLRQLQGNDYDIKVSFDNIKHEIEWKKQNLPIQLNDDITAILNTGFIYAHGKDNRYRPLLFLNPAKYNKEKYPLETWTKAASFFIEFLLNKYLVPGKVENWNIIVDCKDLSAKAIPWDLKTVFSGIKGVYRCRLYKLYLLNLSSIFLFAWKMAKALIGPTVEAKATMINADNGEYNDLFKTINRNQVEKKFGGFAPTLTDGEYFPEKFNYPYYYSKTDKENGNYICRSSFDYIVDNDEIFYETYSDEE